MVARKTKRVAVVTAVSASLVMAGAAAFADPNYTWPPCPRGNGQGQGQGAPSHHDNHPGKGYYKGWPHKRCKNNDQNGGGNPGGNPGGNNSGGATNGDDHGISVEVNVEVNPPNIVVPNAVDSVLDHAITVAGQTVTLAESDVAGLMEIVGAASEGATALVNGTAQAGLSLSGTGASGTVNVSSGAAGATTLASNLTGSTLNLVHSNVTGGGYILGSMLAIL